jgi:hypothetical protein
MLPVLPAAASYRASGLVLWHKCEVPRSPLYRRYWEKSGSDSDIIQADAIDLKAEVAPFEEQSLPGCATKHLPEAIDSVIAHPCCVFYGEGWLRSIETTIATSHR